MATRQNRWRMYVLVFTSLYCIVLYRIALYCIVYSISKNVVYATFALWYRIIQNSQGHTHTGMKRQQKFINNNNNKANIYSLYCSIYTTQTHGSFVCPSFHPSIISFAMVIRWTFPSFIPVHLLNKQKFYQDCKLNFISMFRKVSEVHPSIHPTSILNLSPWIDKEIHSAADSWLYIVVSTQIKSTKGKSHREKMDWHGGWVDINRSPAEFLENKVKRYHMRLW